MVSTQAPLPVKWKSSPTAPPGVGVAPLVARWRGTLGVLALALLVGLAFQGSRHLWDPDEGRYSDVAYEMIDLHDWLVPRLDPDRPHFTKPPLTYWAIASSVSVFGRNEWAARLPNAVGFALTGLLVFGVARRLGLRDPVFAAGAWATMWGPALGANVLSTDTLLVLFETLAVYGVIASGLVTEAGPPRRGPLRLFWLGSGLAFLTKGPPGLLPALAVVAWVAWSRRAELRRLFDPLGLALFALVGLGWFVLVIWRAPDLLRYFVMHETLGRVATGEYARNSGWLGWFDVYAPTLAVGTLPWLPLVAASLVHRGRRRAAAGAIDPSARRFLLLWLLLPLVVFVLSRSRLPLYVLPLFVPLALLFAPPMRDRLGSARRAWLALALGAALIVGVKGAVARVRSDHDAQVLAVDLARAVDLSRVDEVIFVDVTARYGLRHYLGMNIEQVESRPGTVAASGYAAPEPLCHELDTPTRKLLVLPTWNVETILTQAQACRHHVERVGQLRRWVLYRAEPEAPPS